MISDYLSCTHSPGNSGIQPDVRSSCRSCRCQSRSCCRGQTWGKDVKSAYVQAVFLAIFSVNCDAIRGEKNIKKPLKIPHRENVTVWLKIIENILIEKKLRNKLKDFKVKTKKNKPNH